MTPTNDQIREVIGGDIPDKTIERLRAVCGLSSTPCSAFEVAPIDLQFECTHAVYVTGGDSSICYVTSEQRGRLIVFALNELKAAGKLDQWMNNEQN